MYWILCAAHPAHNSAPLIVGGKEAEKGEFPHIVYIKRSNFLFCGASIVNENWVVTSAQCARSSQNGYTLIAGEHKVSEHEDSEQERSVSEIIVHENFNSNTNENDVAVMRVNTPFTFNDYVQPATLASPSFEPTGDLTAAGWGTVIEGGDYPDVLLKVSVPFVAEGDCRQAYGSDKIFPGMLCAGTINADTCQGDWLFGWLNRCFNDYVNHKLDFCVLGDLGGPLLDNATLLGIVSWSYACGSPIYPGVYSDIRHFSTWIKNKTS